MTVTDQTPPALEDVQPGEDAEAALNAARAEAEDEALHAELEVVPPAAAHPALMVANEHLALIKATLNPDLSDGEALLFAQVCNRVGLDPFARQIYAVKRSGRMTIQTGIDGFRLIARRTGQYGGRLGPYFAGEDGQWRIGPDGKPLPWLEKDHPQAAMVGVVRKGDIEPTWGVALWSEYAITGKGDDMWRKMPTTMLAKCAEAQAHRATFPAETSGIYTDDEMMQANAIPARSTAYTGDDPDGEEAPLDDRFLVVCRIRALPDESRDALRERWDANTTLKGVGVWQLNHRGVRAAIAMLNGVEGEARRHDWDMEAAHEEVRQAILALAGVDDPGPEPAQDRQDAPDGSGGAGSAPDADDAAAATGAGAAGTPEQVTEEQVAEVIAEVKAMSLPKVDDELRRMHPEGLLGGEPEDDPVRGSGQDRRQRLAFGYIAERYPEAVIG